MFLLSLPECFIRFKVCIVVNRGPVSYSQWRTQPVIELSVDNIMTKLGFLVTETLLYCRGICLLQFHDSGSIPGHKPHLPRGIDRKRLRYTKWRVLCIPRSIPCKLHFKMLQYASHSMLLSTSITGQFSVGKKPCDLNGWSLVHQNELTVWFISESSNVLQLTGFLRCCLGV